jgi:hypothetical protein
MVIIVMTVPGPTRPSPRATPTIVAMVVGEVDEGGEADVLLPAGESSVCVTPVNVSEGCAVFGGGAGTAPRS